ncbi:MAG: hypothetical protein U0R71_09080 [Solirubrobacterales bacterium]
MRHLKILGLAVIAAAALTAFVGASSASATVLCNTSTNPCGSKLAGESTIKAELSEGKAVLTAGLGKVECSVSEIEGKTGAAAGSNTGALSKLSLSSCNAAFETKKAGSLTVNYTSGANGQVVAEGFEVFYNLGGIECTYGGTVSEGITATGGSPMIVKAVNAPIPKLKGGILCGNPMKLNAIYKVTTPSSLFVAEK